MTSTHDLSEQIRREALVKVIAAAERAHSDLVAAFGPHFSREEAIIAVLDEASAHWQLEVAQAPVDTADWESLYREVAAEIDQIASRARTIIFAALPAETRRHLVAED